MKKRDHAVVDGGELSTAAVSKWHARLNLRLIKTDRGTRLIDNEHDGPLYVQRPFYPETADLAHLYLLHPPAGLVSGDSLDIEVSLGAGSQALLTTPGAGKVYRARQDLSPQCQRVAITLEEAASVEWLPQETIVYPGANGKFVTRVDLADNSRFLGWEITCLGLSASGDEFVRGEINLCFKIYQQGVLKLLDKFHINGEETQRLQARAGLQYFTVNAVFVAGPVDKQTNVMALLSAVNAINTTVDVLFAGTLVGDFIVIRYLGARSEQAKRLFRLCWQLLRPQLLGRVACSPRIWAT